MDVFRRNVVRYQDDENYCYYLFMSKMGLSLFTVRVIIVTTVKICSAGREKPIHCQLLFGGILQEFSLS